jgi:signal transduction histidine kinase
VRVESADGELVLQVADRGPGVPPEERENVFEPFVTTKRAGEGTGLGLAIAREIVEAHGGRVELLEPASDGGAIFQVRLPCGQSPRTGA